MNDNKISQYVVNELIKKYGKKIPVYLHYNKKKPYEFLFAVIMSAQCTDKRVNEVTSFLYKKYDSLKKFVDCDIKILENDIHSVGFFHNKALSINKCASVLYDEYDGKIPKDFDELLKLPGVGRKTASVVSCELYNIPAMAVDTHVKRISKKIFGLNLEKVEDIEKFLKKTIDKKYWHLWNTHIIALGREICVARKPKCIICPLKKVCKGYIDEN